MRVYCIGMNRGLSAWQREVAAQILERRRSDGPAGKIDGLELVTLEWSDRFVGEFSTGFPPVQAEDAARILYSDDDFRDFAFSIAQEFKTSLEDVVERGWLEQWLEADRSWRNHPDCFCQSSTTIQADPPRAIQDLASFLGVELTEVEVVEIAERHPLEARRGSWRDQATLDRMAALARIGGQWLIDRGYEIDLAWSRSVWPDLPKVSYAQNMEDILLDRLFRGRTGTFFDVGANHPTHNNNTYYYYLRGWRGVNVEPVPSGFVLFGDRRPEDLNLELAISDEEGVLPFYEIADCNGLSSLSSVMAAEQQARGFEVIERQISTRTIASLVEQYQLEPPDIFSIDVEGNEEKVIRGIPLDRWQPRVFVIEATRPMTNTLCHQSWEPILLDHGYRFAMFDGINRFYLRADLAWSLPLFDCPVNSLDFYERAETVEQRQRADSLQRLYEEERRRWDEARAGNGRETQDRAEVLAQIAAERDAWQRERDAWQRERDAWQRERDAWQQERDASIRESDAWQIERDAVQRERDVFQAERVDLARRSSELADQLQGVRADLNRANFALQVERFRAEQERQDRDREMEEVKSRLRPYRLIDRFGVVTALHRRARIFKARVKSSADLDGSR